MRVLIIFYFILSGLLFPVLAPQALAATINVTTSATDTLNGANGQCSLREAIQNINDAATTCPSKLKKSSSRSEQTV